MRKIVVSAIVAIIMMGLHTTGVCAAEVYASCPTAETIAQAFVSNDYATIQSIARNFNKYINELAPFLTVNGSKQRYNFSTSKGPMALTHYSDGEFASIIDIGLALHDSATGNAVTAQTNADNRRRQSYGWKMCDKGVYGVDVFILGDKYVSYVKCRNGYEYMDIQTDGLCYSSVANYPNSPDIYSQAAASVHLCTH